ncbi:hypothetical protein [Acetobacter okinawensis]|uniref:hypothetical protein n=1 Tax=Acetobacter okinawensis TaxID=1076594 RepID=UPI0039ED83A4
MAGLNPGGRGVDGPTPPWCDATERAMTTTGAGGLSGPGPWMGLGMQGAGVAEGSTPSATQSGTQAGASAQVGLPSATTLVQSARTTLAQAQAQQAGVMLSLSAGAQSLLDGSTLLGVVGRSATTQGGSTATSADSAQAALADTAQNTAQNVAQGTAQGAASGLASGLASGSVASGAGISTLVADVMQAVETVLADPAATDAQKTMASQLVRMLTAMAGQSASAWTSGMVASLPLLQAEVLPSGAAGGAVVTTSGLYGLARSAVLDGRAAMATALQNMGATQGEEIVLPGGIVQLSQSMAQGAGASVPVSLAGNALTNALLPELFRALSALVADQSATDAQKAAATLLLQLLGTEEEDGAGQIPQALLNPLLAAALMPALTPAQRGRLVRATLAGEAEDMGRTEELDLSGGPGAGGLRAALRRNAAYLAAVQQPLLNQMLQQAQTEEAEPLLADWSAAALRRGDGVEEVLEGGSVLALSQNLMADSPYMGALSSTGLTPILIMSWAALLSGCLPRAYPFVPRVWRRADKKKWRRKNQRNKMDLQSLLFTEGAMEV